MGHSAVQQIMVGAILLLLTACGAPQVAQVVATPSATVTQQQTDAWVQVRAALPADVPVYRPTFVPERFGQPEMLQVRPHDPHNEGRPSYTVLYSAPGENLAFILGIGQGAFGNSAPPDTTESITVNGVSGTLSTSTTGSPSVAVSWQNGSNAYEIKAYSQQLTKEEMQQIVATLESVP